MEERQITYEVAKLARKKGFDEKCIKEFNSSKDVVDCHYSFVKNSDIDYGCLCTSTTQSIMQKWLREVHNIHINPNPYRESIVPGDTEITGYYVGEIYNKEGKEIGYIGESNFATYEDALERGLLKGLSLIS